jgi:hypothetical protein
MVLFHRSVQGVPVDRCRGGINQALDLAGDGRHGDVERASDIDFKGSFRKLVTLQEPDCGKVKDAVDAGHAPFEQVAVQDIAAMRADANARIAKGITQIVETAAREIVVNDHFLDIMFQQDIHDMAADQSSASNDHDLCAVQLHGFLFHQSLTTHSPNQSQREKIGRWVKTHQLCAGTGTVIQLQIRVNINACQACLRASVPPLYTADRAGIDAYKDDIASLQSQVALHLGGESKPESDARNRPKNPDRRRTRC